MHSPSPTLPDTAPSAFFAGQRVRLVQVDKRMNRILQSHLNEEATVIRIIDETFCEVRFDRSDKAYGIWGVSTRRLEPVESEKGTSS